jgi:C4-dicarboxylate-specific signal transduction histidine kinase
LRSVGQCLLGSIAVALLTFVGFRLHIGLTIVALFFLIIVVLLSITGGFVPSIFTSVIAVLCLDYFFATPLFSLELYHPLDVVTLVTFLTIASVISLLMLQRQRFGAALRESEQRHRADQAEQALHESQLELARVTRVLTLGEMTASIAHEINQPLAGVVTNGQAALRWLSQDPPRLDEVQSAVERIVRDGNRASNVIGRIRAIASKTGPQKTSLSINDVIQEGIGLVRREILRRGVSSRTEFASTLPPVIGDRVQLEQVIVNLVINGVEAMTSITDRPREILIRSEQQAEHVLVAVRDAGIGIEAATAEHL